jgi:hypothetical protein
MIMVIIIISIPKLTSIIVGNCSSRTNSNNNNMFGAYHIGTGIKDKTLIIFQNRLRNSIKPSDGQNGPHKLQYARCRDSDLEVNGVTVKSAVNNKFCLLSTLHALYAHPDTLSIFQLLYPVSAAHHVGIGNSTRYSNSLRYVAVNSEDVCLQ